MVSLRAITRPIGLHSKVMSGQPLLLLLFQSAHARCQHPVAHVLKENQIHLSVLLILPYTAAALHIRRYLVRFFVNEA